MITARVVTVILWALALSSAGMAENTIHISPQGDDAASGVADARVIRKAISYQ